MNRFVAFLLVSLCCCLAQGAFGQGLDDEYVQVFKLIQEADTLSSTAPSQALAKYLDAQAALDRLHKGSPEWNTRIVNYRLSYLADRIRALSAVASPPAAKTNAPSATAAAEALPQAAQAQLSALQEQVRQLQSQNGTLEAKLKEALALRPAAAEPTQLAKAEDRINVLQKENESLKVRLQNQQQVTAPPPDNKSLEAAQKSLKETERKLADQNARLSKLTLEKEALENRLKNGNSDAAASSALAAENQRLKQQLTSLQATSPAVPKPQDTSRQLVDAKGEISKLQADKESLRLEKVALENRVKQLSVNGASTSTNTGSVLTVSDDSARIKQLESQRDDLQKRLDALLKVGAGRKGKNNSARAQDLENQLAMARARLEVFDARAVPYTPEELQLLQTPAPALTATDAKPARKSINELPAGSKELVAEAQRSFAAKDYDKAEAAYLQVLKQDPKNVPTLGNLAAIEVESQHLDKAEANIKQALAQDPEDPYSLYVLGILRFRQGKYDEALDALSHSAKLDPQNAEVQNYLGLALSEKGQRAPAEAALRRAVQLQPGYAAAHYNLAVVYATQQPPATELARWHYQKAIGGGHPRNADLEKRMERQ